MARFAHPEYLYGLALVPLLVVLYWWAGRLRKRALKRFGNPDLLRSFTSSGGSTNRGIKLVVLAVAMAVLTLGIANPQIGSKMEEVKREGVDLFIALDVSNSMKAEDIKPNRLESAKREIGQLIGRLQNDRIGLIVFGGESYLQLPLTTDYGAARLILSTIDVDIVPIQGTAIGSAIRLAMKSFVEGERKHKVIVVITDGENHEDDAIEAAKEAAEEGAIVHTIGMGSPLGGPIPVYQNGVQTGYKKDRDGAIVLTKLDESILRQVAEAGEGIFIRATNQDDELEELFGQIMAMEKKEFGARIVTEYEDRFQIFLLIALALFVAEFIISERRHPLFAGWKNRVMAGIGTETDSTVVRERKV